jgi:hypothetical protein
MQIERGLQAMMAAASNPETTAASAHRPNCLMPAEGVVRRARDVNASMSD